MECEAFKLLYTDMIQAKVVSKNKKYNLFYLLALCIKSKLCRIHLCVRLRSSNTWLSFISKMYLNKYFIEIGRGAKIGEYFFMPHPRCIIISNESKIGKHVHVGQYVTIGGSFKKKRKIQNSEVIRHPVIGDNVMVMPGAVIGGPVIIGSHVVIGANSVVTKDVMSGKIVVGQNSVSEKEIYVPDEGGAFSVIDD